ncbi:MAG: MscL family protein [Candidatus Saccharimonadales bacterium]|nr:MscL family protein [Candidatus Saccharimonadales bacterium]
MKGFVDFVREQGVVGLAVGLAIGVAAGNAVATIVAGFIDPIIGWILGGSNLGAETWTLVDATADRPALIFSWGAILSSIITLLAVAFVIYYLVKGLGLDKLDKKKKD